MEESKQQRCHREARKYPRMHRKKTRRDAKNISQYAYQRSPRIDEEAARSQKIAQKLNEHYEFILRRRSDPRTSRKFETSCNLPSSCKLPLAKANRKSGETDRNTSTTAFRAEPNRAQSEEQRNGPGAELRNQHQLARRLPRLHEFVRLCRLRQRERLAHQQLELALRDQLERFFDSAPHQVGYAGHRVQREGAHLGRFLKQLEHVERLGRSARASIENEMPKRR